MGRKVFSLVASIFLFFNFPLAIYAMEIQVSGNGENSSSQVTTINEQTSNVTQSNEAKVDNNVNVNSNTGNNLVSNSQGDSSIETGNAKTQVEVSNSLNSNQITENDCKCSNGQDVKVIGNGEGSQQNVKIGSSNQNNLNQNNNALITTNISGNINTGLNKVNGNQGSALITTGNISAKVNISNKSVNQSAIIMPANSNNSLSLSVSGNGANSVNSINVSTNQKNKITVNNNLKIENNLNLDLNTGFNEIDGLMGDSIIKTGDIFVNVEVENEANSSFVHVNCDCYHVSDPGDPLDPGVSDPGQQNSNSNSNNDSRGGTSNVSNSSNNPSVLGLSFTGINQNLLTGILFGASIVFLGSSQLFFEAKER